MSCKILRYLYVLAILLVMSPAVSAQQPKKRKNQPRPKVKRKSAPVDPRFTAGAMFDDQMIKAAVKRYAHDLSISIGMDDNTSEKVRQSLEARWVPFLQKNRHNIAPLISRFYRHAIDPDPPAIEDVQGWAQDALSMYDGFVEEMNKSDQDVVKHLSPAQVDRYRLETGKVRMGLGLFRGQLVKWEQGDFDYSEWTRQQTSRDRQRRTDRKKREREIFETALSSPELALVTIGAWDKYVADFIKKYGLDEAQKSSASSILADVKDRANQYIKKNESAIDGVRTKLQSVSPQERPALMEDKVDLLKPLDELFAELKRRLDVLPTDAQRTKSTGAIQVKPAAPPTKKAAKKGAGGQN